MPTSQSEIQSLLQDLSGVQTTAQSNVPGAINNGSPNTVYNTPQSSSPPSPWVQYNPVQGAGGYMPPVTNANGQWMINKGPQPGTAIDWNQMIQDIAGPILPTWNIPPPQTNPIPPPGTTPPPANTGGQLPPTQVPPGSGGDVAVGGGGCVVVESYIDGRDGRASSVKKRDLMVTIDPRNMVKGVDVVTYAETKPQPCVRIRTESGIELECSVTAPIADSKGNQVLAPNLKDVAILVMDNDIPRVEYVVEVEDIGNRLVRHITCGNKFFLAGKVKGRYVLHHNVKYTGFGLREADKVTGGNPDWLASTGGSTDYAGQYGASGATLGNIISQSPQMAAFASFAIGATEPTVETTTTALKENESTVKSILGTVGVNVSQAWHYITSNPTKAAMSLGAAILTGNLGPLINLLGGAGINAIKTPDK